ncbi:hypothetical protein HDU97_000614 [Phlyctochytrium planicorne]|nr:hypothetical protein HDU97_000614 [Phlyctochytrium planicorne]
MSSISGISIAVLPPLSGNGQESTLAMYLDGFPGVSDFTIRGRIVLKNKKNSTRGIHALLIELSGHTVARFVNSRSFPAEELYQRKRHLQIETPVSLTPLQTTSSDSHQGGAVLPHGKFEVPFEILVPETERIVPSCTVGNSSKNFERNDVMLPNGTCLQKSVSWLSCDTWYELTAKLILVGESASSHQTHLLFQSPRVKLPFGLLSPIEPHIVQAYAMEQSTTFRHNFENQAVTFTFPNVIRSAETCKCIISSKDSPVMQSSPPPSPPHSNTSSSPPLRPRRSTFSGTDRPPVVPISAPPSPNHAFGMGGGSNTIGSYSHSGKTYGVSNVKLELIQHCILSVRETGANVSSILLTENLPHYIVSDIGRNQHIHLEIPSIAPTTLNHPEFNISYTLRLSISFVPRKQQTLAIASFSHVPATIFNFPVVVAPFDRQKAELASADSPWLFLPLAPTSPHLAARAVSPTQPVSPLGRAISPVPLGSPTSPFLLASGSVAGGRAVSPLPPPMVEDESVPIPPRCWRTVGVVDGELPSYMESLRNEGRRDRVEVGEGRDAEW